MDSPRESRALAAAHFEFSTHPNSHANDMSPYSRNFLQGPRQGAAVAAAAAAAAARHKPAVGGAAAADGDDEHHRHAGVHAAAVARAAAEWNHEDLARRLGRLEQLMESISNKLDVAASGSQ